MMTTQLSQRITDGLRNRRGLLWVTQRYDLNLSETPHDLALPPNEAALRYRSAIEDTDRDLASLYWEAAWFEGAKSQLLKAMQENAENQPSKNRRPVVVLAGSADAAATVPTGEFFPTIVLPGQLLVVWPKDEKTPDLDIGQGVSVSFWLGNTAELVEELLTTGASPAAGEVPRQSVRVGRKIIQLSSRELDRIERRFALIKEEHLGHTNSFSLQNLEHFLEGSLDDWRTPALAFFRSPRNAAYNASGVIR